MSNSVQAKQASKPVAQPVKAELHPQALKLVKEALGAALLAKIDGYSPLFSKSAKTFEKALARVKGEKIALFDSFSKDMVSVCGAQWHEYTKGMVNDKALSEEKRNHANIVEASRLYWAHCQRNAGNPHSFWSECKAWYKKSIAPKTAQVAEPKGAGKRAPSRHPDTVFADAVLTFSKLVSTNSVKGDKLTAFQSACGKSKAFKDFLKLVESHKVASK